MKFVVTKSKTILGKVITWGLDEPVSHFSLVFDQRFVISSNLLGVHLSWYKTLCQNSVSYYEIDMPLPLEKEEEVYLAIMNGFDGSNYDYDLFLKFIEAGIKKKLFKKPIDLSKSSTQNNKFLCTEIIQLLPDWLVSADTKQKTLGLVSPWMLFNILVTEIKKNDPE